MFLHPREELAHHLIVRSDPLHFGRVPPEAGLGKGLRDGQWPLEAAGVGRNVNELGEDLGGKRCSAVAPDNFPSQ